MDRPPDKVARPSFNLPFEPPNLATDQQPIYSPALSGGSSTTYGASSNMLAHSRGGASLDGESVRIYPIRLVKHIPSLHRQQSDETTVSMGSKPTGLELSDVESNSSDSEFKGGDQQLKAGMHYNGSSRSRADSVQTEAYITARFEHSIMEDGANWVVTGREGVLQRCEDEPIRAPGAVQSFGVLIAFDVEEDGRLFVQQASENAGHILGITTSSLFRSQNFLDFLDEDESEVLTEALEALDERDADEESENGPFTFQLSGQGAIGSGLERGNSRLPWSAYSAIHRPDRATAPKRVILELEIIDDELNPLTTAEVVVEKRGLPSFGVLEPTEEDLIKSTVSIVKPLRALAKSKKGKAGRAGAKEKEIDVVQLLSQVNDQFSKADDLDTFLKITVGVFKEITAFDRVMLYSFDSDYNGSVVAEEVDYSKAKDIFRGLNFPATDIPQQARDLYMINKVRCVYDIDQPTARMCCRSLEEVDNPLNMTHAHLRAMSPIHIKYLANMGVRSSMSISVTAFGRLYGLIAHHNYSSYGHRVSFAVKELCKLLGDSVSRNIERLSYAKRLHARKLINTAPSTSNPSGYIIAKAEDLLSLFSADYGVLSIGDEAKILGSIANSQEILACLEYLRAKCFTSLVYSENIIADFPDIYYPSGFKILAGLLTVPLSSEGKDFIVFFRIGQLSEKKWAGNPYTNKVTRAGGEMFQPLEPRKSFASWSETVVGKCKSWTEEEIETAGVLCLVYGKFIDVWRQKESALAESALTNLLLANASHEVRTPLNAIINYLEMAIDSTIDDEVKEHLTKSHAASRTLIHVINDLLDLTRTEKGQTLFLQDPFDLPSAISDAVSTHRDECERQGLFLDVVETPQGTPPTVLGDRAKIKSLVMNVVANAVKHTKTGGILVEWGELVEEIDTTSSEREDSIRIGISITDTGSGIDDAKLEQIFRQFEEVTTIQTQEEVKPTIESSGLGLGLAVVARIVRNLGGQLRVESKVGVGTKFTLIVPFSLPFTPTRPDLLPSTSNSTINAGAPMLRIPRSKQSGSSIGSVRSTKSLTNRSEIDSLISSLSASHMSRFDARHSSSSKNSITPAHDLITPPQSDYATPRTNSPSRINSRSRSISEPISSPITTINNISHPSRISSRLNPNSVLIESTQTETGVNEILATYIAPRNITPSTITDSTITSTPTPPSPSNIDTKNSLPPLKVLVVEDEPINRMIIQKRLQKDGHFVVLANHGGEAIRLFEEDQTFDIVLMDLQMPIVNGYEAANGIRELELKLQSNTTTRQAPTLLNGRLPILAVSASLHERQRESLMEAGIDGWILKPIDFKRLNMLLKGSLNNSTRNLDVYRPGAWEKGGWLEPK